VNATATLKFAAGARTLRLEDEDENLYLVERNERRHDGDLDLHHLAAVQGRDDAVLLLIGPKLVATSAKAAAAIEQIALNLRGRATAADRHSRDAADFEHLAGILTDHAQALETAATPPEDLAETGGATMRRIRPGGSYRGSRSNVQGRVMRDVAAQNDQVAEILRRRVVNPYAWWGRQLTADLAEVLAGGADLLRDAAAVQGGAAC
jgi:hypothetical protein